MTLRPDSQPLPRRTLRTQQRTSQKFDKNSFTATLCDKKRRREQTRMSPRPLPCSPLGQQGSPQQSSYSHPLTTSTFASFDISAHPPVAQRQDHASGFGVSEARDRGQLRALRDQAVSPGPASYDRSLSVLSLGAAEPVPSQHTVPGAPFDRFVPSPAERHWSRETPGVGAYDTLTAVGGSSPPGVSAQFGAMPGHCRGPISPYENIKAPADYHFAEAVATPGPTR
jgi:hypothetical protein